MDASKLHVVVRSNIKTFFEGDASTVTATNKRGTFDILPLHTSFISIIEKELIVLDLNNKPTKVAFNEAVLKVRSNSVYVFLES